MTDKQSSNAEHVPHWWALHEQLNSPYDDAAPGSYVCRHHSHRHKHKSCPTFSIAQIERKKSGKQESGMIVGSFIIDDHVIAFSVTHATTMRVSASNDWNVGAACTQRLILMVGGYNEHFTPLIGFYVLFFFVFLICGKICDRQRFFSLFTQHAKHFAKT